MFTRILFATAIFGFLVANETWAREFQNQARNPEEKIASTADLIDKLPDATAENALLQLLEDKDPEVCKETLSKLADVKQVSASTKNELVVLSGSSDPDTRRLAVVALSGRGIESNEEIDAVLKSLSDPIVSVRLAGANTAAAINSPTRCPAPEISKLLQDGEREVQLAALATLKKMKCDSSIAVTGLMETARSKSPELRLKSIETLGSIEGGADAAESLLVNIGVNDPDAEVRREALLAIGNAKSSEVENLKGLDRTIRDPVADVRGAAAYALAEWRGDNSHAYDLLQLLQKDPNEEVRYEVASAFQYARLNEKILSIAAISLLDKSPSVRFRGVLSLAKLGSKPGAADKPENGDDDSDYDPLHRLLEPDRPKWGADLFGACLANLSDPSFNTRFSMLDVVEHFSVDDDRVLARVAIMATTDDVYLVRAKAVEILPNLKMNRISLDGLIGATSDKYSYVRLRAVRVLGKLSSDDWPFTRPRETINGRLRMQTALASRLSDGDWRVRQASARTISKLYGKLNPYQFPYSDRLSTALRLALKDRDPDVRAAAALAFGDLRSATVLDVRALTAALFDENLVVETAVAKGLGRMVPDVHRIKQSVGLARISALSFVTMKGAVSGAKVDLRSIKKNCDVIDALIRRSVKPPAASVDLESLKSLASMTSAMNETLTAIDGGKLPEDPEFVDLAVNAVDIASPCVEKAATYITSRLDDPDPNVRMTAVYAVGRTPIVTPLAVSRLYESINDANSGVRLSGVFALSQIVANFDSNEKDRDKIVAALVSKLSDSSHDVRQKVVRSLLELNSIELLQQIFGSQDPDIRSDILDGLSSKRIPLVSVQSAITLALKDSDRKVRVSALLYLSSRGMEGQSFIEQVAPLLGDKSSEVRKQAASELGYFRSASSLAVPKLVELLNDKDDQVRGAAVETLGWIGPGSRDAIPELARLASGPNTAGEPLKALKALKKIGPEAAESLQYVRDHSNDKDQQELATKFAREFLQNTVPSVRISLKDGSEHNLEIRDGVIVMSVATWCPYSRKLKDFLSREDVKPYLQDFQVIFLLEDETDEVLAHVREQLKEEHGDWSSERKQELLQTIRTQVSSTGYFDPSFVTTLPGKHLQVVSLKKLYSDGFPEVLSPTLTDSDSPTLSESSWMNVHEWVYSDWFSEHVLMPDNLKRDFYPSSMLSLLGL